MKKIEKVLIKNKISFRLKRDFEPYGVICGFNNIIKKASALQNDTGYGTISIIRDWKEVYHFYFNPGTNIVDAIMIYLSAILNSVELDYKGYPTRRLGYGEQVWIPSYVPEGFHPTHRESFVEGSWEYEFQNLYGEIMYVI